MIQSRIILWRFRQNVLSYLVITDIVDLQMVIIGQILLKSICLVIRGLFYFFYSRFPSTDDRWCTLKWWTDTLLSNHVLSSLHQKKGFFSCWTPITGLSTIPQFSHLQQKASVTLDEKTHPAQTNRPFPLKAGGKLKVYFFMLSVHIRWNTGALSPVYFQPCQWYIWTLLCQKSWTHNMTCSSARQFKSD